MKILYVDSSTCHADQWLDSPCVPCATSLGMSRVAASRSRPATLSSTTAPSNRVERSKCANAPPLAISSPGALNAIGTCVEAWPGLDSPASAAVMNCAMKSGPDSDSSSAMTATPLVAIRESRRAAMFCDAFSTSRQMGSAGRSALSALAWSSGWGHHTRIRRSRPGVRVTSMPVNGSVYCHRSPFACTLLPESTNHTSGLPNESAERMMIHASPTTCQHRASVRSSPARWLGPPRVSAAAVIARGSSEGPVGLPVSASSSVAWTSACETALAIHTVGPRTSPMTSQ